MKVTKVDDLFSMFNMLIKLMNHALTMPDISDTERAYVEGKRDSYTALKETLEKAVNESETQIVNPNEEMN